MQIAESEEQWENARDSMCDSLHPGSKVTVESDPQPETQSSPRLFDRPRNTD
jgi:hypothetical protein